jgi:hypothetical protein
MIEGTGDPIYVLENLWNGIDLFEAPYPFELANQHKALTFSSEMPSDYDSEFDDIQDIFSSISAVPKSIELN